MKSLITALVILTLAPTAAAQFCDSDHCAMQARADSGDAAAQFHMGVAHLTGRDVPQDFVEAARYYRLAAEQGDAFSQHSLGIMYREGLGVRRSYVNAHMWLQLAAAQGHQEVASHRDALAARMTPEQLAESLALAHDRMVSPRD